MRAFPWRSTSLGRAETWSPGLKFAIRLALNTQHPVALFYGPDHVFFYNDAYSRSIGPDRHPDALGKPGREVWGEIWDIISPQLEQVMAGGPATWHENHLIPITRHGKRDEVYWTYSYSPIDDPQADSGVGGVLVICNETTPQVLAQRAGLQEMDRLKRLFLQAPSFMALLRGPEHVYEFVNEAYIALAGQRNYAGRTVREVFPELEGQGFYELLDRVYASGQAYTAHKVPVIVQKPGEAPARLYVDFVYQPIRDETGAVAGIFVDGYEITERVLAEQAERQSAARFKAVAEAVPGLIWVGAETGGNVYVNQAYGDYVGMPREDLLGDGWMKVVHPDDLARIAPKLDIIDRAGGTFIEEFRFRRFDGVWRWHLVRSVKTLRSENGEMFWVGAATDIHDRQELLAELRVSDERFNLAAEAAGFGAYDYNALTHELVWTENLYKLTGFEPGEKLDRDRHHAQIHPDDLARFHEVRAQALSPNGPGRHDMEFRYRRPSDGAELWLRDSGRSFVEEVDGERKVVRVVGAVVDITSRRRVEEDLRASEARFRAMADNIDQLAWMARPDGHIFWYNKRWRDYTGQSMADAQGWGWVDVHHPDHIEQVKETWTAALNQGRPWEHTFPLRSAQGEYRWFLSRAHPIYDEHGAITLWFGTNTDVTEQRRSDEARALLAREVDHRAKNALAVCQSIVRLSRAETRDGLVKSVSGRIAAMARAQSLLSEARWEGGDFLRMLQRELAALAAPESFELDGPAFVLQPDAVQGFSLLVHELATNAAKYGALSRPDGRVRVSWSLAPDGLRFQWTERGGPAIEQPPEHTGFGSTMIREIGERQLGGALNHDWRVEGLSVSGVFPLRLLSSEAVAAGPATHSAPPPQIADARRGRVLIVEDTPLVAMDMAQTLAADGWDVVGPAHTLEDGLAAAHNGAALAVAVLDFDLGGKPAEPIALALRARSVPIIWVSGFGAETEKAFAGARHIQKPIDHARFLAAVAAAAEEARQA